MVNLEFSEKHDQKFLKHFNGQMDDITLILKCHLLLEEMLRDFCSAMVPQPRFLTDSRFTFSQVLDLSKALYPNDIKIGSLSDLWSVAEKVNRVRNMMAHTLDPDSSKLEVHKDAIRSTIRARFKGCEDLEFSGCLTAVLGSFSLILQIGVTHKNGEDFRKIPKR